MGRQDHVGEDTTARAHRLAAHFADVLNRADVSLLDTLVTEDYINHNPFVAPGRQGVKEFFTAWLASFPDTRVTVEDALSSADGNKVVARITYKATHTGAPFLGIPQSGKPITMRSIDIWRVGDGRFTEHWDELNLLQVFQQLGVIPHQFNKR